MDFSLDRPSAVLLCGSLDKFGGHQVSGTHADFTFFRFVQGADVDSLS